MARRLVVGILGLLGFWNGAAALAPAQQILDDLYGQGVHAFHDRDFATSVRWLSEAIEQGTRDPRAYYFRGLSHLRLGDDQAASADFAQGAELETSATDQFFPIAESLARVQGNARVQIESARREARRIAKERLAARERARYEATVAAESRVLRGRDAGVAVPKVEVVGDVKLPFPNEPVGTVQPTTLESLDPNWVPSSEPSELPAAPDDKPAPAGDGTN